MGMWLGVRAGVRVRGLTRFHVAMVQFVLSAGDGKGGQAMRRAGHARLARALGGSVPDQARALPHRHPLALLAQK